MQNWFARPTPDQPTYRAYRMALNGNIVTAEVVDAEDDAQAVTIARVLATLHPIELWERARFLGRFEPAAELAAV